MQNLNPIYEQYKVYRATGNNAKNALLNAKRARLAGKRIYGKTPLTYNQETENGGRWVENASDGLRLVGYADEIAKRIDHKGWYADEEPTDNVLRGIVYRLPARNKQNIFAYGYADPYNEGAAYLIFDTHYNDDEIGAAWAADKIAQKYAEQEKEYNEAWRAGSDYAEEKQGIKETRQALLQLIAAIKAEKKRGAAPVICNALNEQIKAHLRIIRKAKNHAAKLWDDYEHLREPRNHWRKDLWLAFCDGAGIPSGEVQNAK